MKIAITGATGFVGANLVRHFARRGDEVVAIGRGVPPADLLRFAKWVPGDIRQPLPRLEVDAVVHAAALADDHARLDDLLAANLQGTKNVFEALGGCPIFIQISSSSVYEPGRGKNESEAGGNLSAYGKTKLAADEWLFSQRADNQKVCILRPRAIYGIGDRVLLPKILRLQVTKRLALLPGKLEAESSMTHVSNLAQAVECCIFEKTAGIFNLADESPYRLSDVFKALLSRVGGVEQFAHLPEGLIKTSMKLKSALGVSAGLTEQAWQYLTQDAVLDISKAKNELNYNPTATFWNQLDGLAEWVGKIGKQQVKNAAPALPWLTM